MSERKLIIPCQYVVSYVDMLQLFQLHHQIIYGVCMLTNAYPGTTHEGVDLACECGMLPFVMTVVRGTVRGNRIGGHSAIVNILQSGKERAIKVK